MGWNREKEMGTHEEIFLSGINSGTAGKTSEGYAICLYCSYEGWYRYLKKQIEDEIPNLPDMSKIIIEEMDQREYYRKKRRNYGIAALGVTLFIPLVLDAASIIMGIFVIVIQYMALWNIFKAVYFGKKAEIKIEKRFAKDTEIKLHIRKVSYLYLIVVAVLMAGLNAFWIWF